jgi:hypothetical protein
VQRMAQIQYIKGIIHDLSNLFDNTNIIHVASQAVLCSSNYMSIINILKNLLSLKTSNNLLADVVSAFSLNGTIISDDSNFKQNGSNPVSILYFTIFDYENSGYKKYIVKSGLLLGKWIYLPSTVKTKQVVCASREEIAFCCCIPLLGASHTYSFLLFSQKRFAELFAGVCGSVTLADSSRQSLCQINGSFLMRKPSDTIMLRSGEKNGLNATLHVDMHTTYTAVNSTVQIIVFFAISVILLNIALAMFSVYRQYRSIQRLLLRLKQYRYDQDSKYRAFDFLDSSIDAVCLSNMAFYNENNCYKEILTDNAIDCCLYSQEHTVDESVGLLLNTIAIPLFYGIQQLQLNRACVLLSDTKKQIRDIRSKCGYAMLSVFYKVFKHCIGVSPTQYCENLPHLSLRIQ